MHQWCSLVLTSIGGTSPMRPSMTNVRDMLYCTTMIVSNIPIRLPKPTIIAIQTCPLARKAEVKGAFSLMLAYGTMPANSKAIRKACCHSRCTESHRAGKLAVSCSLCISNSPRPVSVLQHIFFTAAHYLVPESLWCLSTAHCVLLRRNVSTYRLHRLLFVRHQRV